jgi:L-asparaginase II
VAPPADETDALRVTVTRGRVLESVHRVHAVAVRDGAVVAAAGDPGRVCFLRSAWKPIQAVALAESYDDLSDEELAIACASHQAEPAQLAAVRRLLERAGATVDDLENGKQEGRPQGRLGHNCSGKHAGMLAACRARGWPFQGYRLRGHPLQQRLAAELGPTRGEAVDGCGVPTYALALAEAAALLARTRPRVAAAMRARPELVGGGGADDTALMRALPGWTAKRGAEGLLCAVSADGLGLALKVEDGDPRGLRAAAGAFLARLGLEAEGFGPSPLRNSLGETVGELAVAG